MTTRTWQLGLGALLVLAALHVVGRLPWPPTPRLVENRPLAPRPTLPASIGDLHRLRSETDAYVADNLPARPYLIAGLNYLRYRLGYSAAPKIRIGERGWLFYNGMHAPPIPLVPLSEERARQWVEALTSRTAQLRARGISYFVLVPPLKEHVYPQLAPVAAFSDPRSHDVEILAPLASAAGLDNVLDLRPLLSQAAATTQVYSPYDTHWTGRGAYLAYRTFLEAIPSHHGTGPARALQAFTAVEPSSPEAPQDLAVMLGISSLVHQRYPRLQMPATDPTPRVQWLTEKTDWTADRVIDTGLSGKPVLLVTGDSFMSELMPFLHAHFSRIIFAHNRDTHYRPDLIDAYSPDVVLLEVHEPQLRLAMSIGASPLAWQRVDDARPVAPLPALSCGLDSISHSVNPAGQPMIEVLGWVADASGGRTAPVATVVLQSGSTKYRAELAVAVERGDVADYFKKPGLKFSGFYAAGDASTIVPGHYAVTLLQQYGAETMACTSGKEVVVPVATSSPD